MTTSSGRCRVRTRGMYRSYRMSTWKPLFEAGSPFDLKAREVIAEIGDQPFVKSDLRNSCAAGTVEIPLLCAYLAFMGNREYWIERAAEHLEGSLIPKTSSLEVDFLGLARLGWVIEHVSRIFDGQDVPPDDASDVTTQIDRLLLSLLDRGAWQGEPGVSNGICGLG